MKTRLDFKYFSKLRLAVRNTAAALALISASLISVPGLGQNMLFHLLGIADRIANFTATSSIVLESTGLAASWPAGLASWTARRQVIVEGVASAVTDFPLLLKIDSTKINYANTLALGADLRITDSAGNLLAYEIESWNAAGTSYVWVKVPALAAAPDRTILWMYYGNAAASSAQDANAIWSVEHAKILHLNGAVGAIANGAVLGASLGANGAANNVGGTGMAYASGVGGSGVVLDGTDDWISVGADASLNFGASAPFTVQAYVKTTDANGPLLAFRDTATGSNVIGLYVGFNGATTNAGRMNILMRDSTGGADVQILGPVVNDGAWHHVAVTRNAGSEIELFVDGQSYGTGSSAATGNAFSTDLRSVGVDRYWVLNALHTADQRFLAATVDEIRVSGVKHSDSYFQAQYLAGIDGLAHFLEEETPAQGTSSITVTLSSPATEIVTIPYVVSGTSTPGLDHKLADGDFVIGIGSSSNSIDFQVIKDQIDEGNETAILTLGAATGGATVGSNSVHTVTIVDDAQVAPVAVDDVIAITSLSQVTLPVLANDSDANGDYLTISSFTNPGNGTLVKAGQVFYYTPSDDFRGVEQFSYTISDGRGGTATADVTLNFQVPFTWTGLGSDANWTTGDNWIGGVSPGPANTAYFNDQCSASCDPLFAVLSVGGLRLNTSYPGSFNQGAGALTVGSAGFRQRGGTFTGGTHNITVSSFFSVLGGSFQSTTAVLRLNSGDFTLAAPGTFAANSGTLFLGCNYDQVCTVTPGAASYNNVTFAGEYARFELGAATMTVLGNLEAGDSYSAAETDRRINNGTINVSGNYSVINYGYRGSVLIRLVGNASGQTVFGSAGYFMPPTTIAAGANQVTLDGEVVVYNTFTYESGTVATSGSTLRVHCDYALTCTFTPGTVAYNNLRLSSNYGNFTLDGGTATVGGDFTLGDMYGAAYLNQQLNDGTFNVAGSISISPYGYRGSAVINSVGGNSTISADTPSGVPNGTFTVDKSAKTSVLTLSSNMTFAGAGQAMTISTGTVDLAGRNLVVNGTLTIGANGKLDCNGGTVTAGAIVIEGEVACATTIGTTWTGLGGNTFWSNPLNWSNNTLPTGTHTALFNGVCGANCAVTIDSNVSVSGIQMLAGYPGTITQGAGFTVSVSTVGWKQDSGSFVGSNAALTVTSRFTLTGGTFTAPLATMTLGRQECTTSKLVLDVTGGTFNHGGGRLKFNQGRPTTSGSCNGHFSVIVTPGFTTYDLEFSTIDASSWSSTVSYGPGGANPIKVLRNFYDYGSAQELDFDVEGDVYLENSHSPGSGILRLMGAGNQKIFTTGTKSSQVIRVDKSSGDVLPGDAVTNIWLYGLELIQGSFTAPTGTLRLGDTKSVTVNMNSLLIADGTTFLTNGGTIHFSLSRGSANNVTANIVVPLGFEFNNVVTSASVTSSSWNSFIDGPNPLVVAGNLNFGGNSNRAHWQVRGNVSLTGTAPNGGTGSITLNGSTDQTLSGVSTAKASSIIIDSSGGTVTFSGTVVIRTDFTYLNGIVDPGTSTVIFAAYATTARNISAGTMTFNNVRFQGDEGIFTITGTVEVLGATTIEGSSNIVKVVMNGGTVLAKGDLTISSYGAIGTTVVRVGGSTDQLVTGVVNSRVPGLAIDSSGGIVTLAGTINVSRSYEHFNGVVDAGTSTLRFISTELTLSIVPGPTLFNNVTINSVSSVHNLTGTLSTSGTMTLHGTSTSPRQRVETGTLNPQASLELRSKGSFGNSPVTFSGLTAANYSYEIDALRPSGLVTIDKSGGAAVTMTTNVLINAPTGQNLHVAQGKFDLGGFDLTVIDAITVAAGATFTCNGGEFTSTSLTSLGTVECPGYSTYPFNWTGGALDGDFATAGNWQGGVAPVATDIVAFDSAYCGANCDATISADANVKGVRLLSGYAGVLTQGPGATLTVGAKSWIQEGGSFVGGSSPINIVPELNISGGSFVSTAGMLTVQNVFTAYTGGFTHNNGLITVGSPGMGTTSISAGANNLNHFTFGSTSSTNTIVGTLNANGNVTAIGPGGTISGGTLSVGGNLTTGIGGTSPITFTGTSPIQIAAFIGTKPTGVLTVNKAAGEVRLSGNTVFTSSTQDLHITAGTLNMDGYNLSIGRHVYNTLGGVIRRGTSPACGTLSINGFLSGSPAICP